MYYIAMISNNFEWCLLQIHILPVQRAKNNKKNKSTKEQAIDQAIEKDERFSGIMRDPVWITSI